MSASIVIGEGAYGCIHKPSLTCKEPKLKSYKNKVSKVLEKKLAVKEIGEYTAIESADKSHEYYLGNPVNCSVANTPTNIEAIKKCKKGDELIKNLDDLSLLIMDDGGINIKDFADTMEKWSATPGYIEKTERIFIEFHRIIRGITVFLQHDILHLDMKPQNIVYSEETRRMNIIDFGLTVAQKDIVKHANNNTNGMAMYHWSYPFEFHFLNKDTYETFAKLSQKEKEEYYQSILKGIAENDDDDSTKAIKSFYSFIFADTIGSLDFKQHMTGFYQTLLVELTPGNFPAFLKNSLHSVDVYGTGISLLYLLKKTKHLLTDKLYKDLYKLGSTMVSSQLSKRTTADNALLNYETILTENGIMKKYNLYFANHKIEKGQLLSQVRNEEQVKTTEDVSKKTNSNRQMPKYIEKTIESINIKDVLLNDTILKKNAITIDITKQSAIDKTKTKTKTKTINKKTPKPSKKSKTLKNKLDSIKMFYMEK